MIECLQGSPGNGKSYIGICRAKWELSRRHYVVTNIELSPDWPDLFVSKLLPRKMREKRMQQYRDYLHYTHDPDELRRIRLPRCGKCRACKQGLKYCTREGRGLMILDEAHEWLNPRGIDLNDIAGEELTSIASQERAAKLFRRRLVNWLARHRHYGFNVLLISQDEMNIDPQIRRLIEYNTRVRNLRRVKKFGLPMFPFTLFVAVTRWNDKQRSILEVKRYFLSKRVAGAYHSLTTVDSTGDEDTHGLIELPLRNGRSNGFDPNTPEGFYRELLREASLAR